MSSHSRFTLVTALLGLLIGCDNQELEVSEGIARDSAGIRIVELPPWPAARPVTELHLDPLWKPAAGLEIGNLGDIDVILGVGVLLLDELAVNVTVLSEKGELLTVIGRAGQGPGEFDPQGLGRMVATDSSVFVPDLFLQRITEFSLDGRVLGIQPFPYSPVYAVDWRRHPEGGLVFRAFEQFGDQIVRMTREAVDTILSVPFSNDFGNRLLLPTTLWDVSKAGNVVLGRSDSRVLELRQAGTGEVIWRAEWVGGSEELGEDAVAHLEGLVRDNILRDSPDISAEQLAGSLAMIEYPTDAPALAGVMAGPGGDVWVRRAKPVLEMGSEALLIASADGYGSRDWDVLTPEGFFKTRVRLPEGFTPRRFLGDWVYGILADELGVETVARVRVGLVHKEGY